MHYILFIALSLNGRYLQSHTVEFDSVTACRAGAVEYSKFMQTVGDRIEVFTVCIAKGDAPK